MRWSKKISKGPVTGVKAPEIGDTKQKIRFAWLPTKIGKAHKVWLESYIEVWEFQQYQKRQHDPYLMGSKWPQIEYSQNPFVSTVGWRFKENKLS